MRLYEINKEQPAKENDTLNPPPITTGDTVMVGKFKNRKAVVKGFTKDDHGQPVLKTSKGDQQLYKPRISKLEPVPEADQVKAKEKKPKTKAGRKDHPYRGRLVGEKTVKAKGASLKEAISVSAVALPKAVETEIHNFLQSNKVDQNTLNKLLSAIGMSLEIKGERAVIDTIKKYTAEIYNKSVRK